MPGKAKADRDYVVKRKKRWRERPLMNGVSISFLALTAALAVAMSLDGLADLGKTPRPVVAATPTPQPATSPATEKITVNQTAPQAVTVTIQPEGGKKITLTVSFEE